MYIYIYIYIIGAKASPSSASPASPRLARRCWARAPFGTGSNK